MTKQSEQVLRYPQTTTRLWHFAAPKSVNVPTSMQGSLKLKHQILVTRGTSGRWDGVGVSTRSRPDRWRPAPLASPHPLSLS